MSTPSPQAFSCETCGRTSYTMSLAPRCRRCRRAGNVPTKNVPEWVENAMANRWGDTERAVNAFRADPNERTFNDAFRAMKSYGKLRGWL